jgi:class 3 adenylate cyclase
MFSDLVGSTTPKTSAKSFRHVRSALRRPCRRFGGFVAKYMGDGVWRILGIPKLMKTTLNGRFALGWIW